MPLFVEDFWREVIWCATYCSEKIKDTKELVNISNKEEGAIFLRAGFLLKFRCLKRSCSNFNSIDIFSFYLHDTG